jgi:hypothetical protein
MVMDLGMRTLPAHFFDELITVHFSDPPVYEKKPSCPDGFTWREETFSITEVLEEWSDFKRRGRMARNMAPAHIASASRLGSRGVGRFHFRVRTSIGRMFEIYYDRAPEDVDNKKGTWHLLGERKESE